MNMQMRKMMLAANFKLSMRVCVCVCLEEFKWPQETVTKHHNLLLNYRIHCPGVRLLGNKTINVVRHIEGGREGGREEGREGGGRKRGTECFPLASSCMYQDTYILASSCMYQDTYLHSNYVFRPRVSNVFLILVVPLL